MPRGRKPIYSTDEERKQAQREHALRYYYRKKALKAQLDGSTPEPHEQVSIKVDIKSKRLGDISEDITYTVNDNGTFSKKRVKGV